MPKIIRVQLTAEQRAALNERARAREMAPRLRQRLEMVRLSDAGQTIPQIAAMLSLHQQTVRKYLKAFLESGFAALSDKPVPGRPPTVQPADLVALGQLLDDAAAKGQTWTRPQLVRWLSEKRGVVLSPQRLGVLLRRERFRWKRTKRSVRHLQKDPALQDAATAALESLIL